MPGIRTEITEIVTGLAMLGYQDLDRALEVRPRHITHVDGPVFDRIEDAYATGVYADEFRLAWSNGLAFARSPLGLRGRPPWHLEWKGHHKPASKSIETIPADLRIDHVFLISCKYRSRILHNSGPIPLFDHRLSPSGSIGRLNWYEEVSPESFAAVWSPIHIAAGISPGLPPSALNKVERMRVKTLLRVAPIDTSSDDYLAFVRDVSERSAERWRKSVANPGQRRELLWRLLRMQAAPYFVLGARENNEPMRYRVDTPWDWAQAHELDAFLIEAGSRGQPSVDWTVRVSSADGSRHVISGHVEVRWSQGKLTGSPEAKVYLDSAPSDVPGYEPI